MNTEFYIKSIENLLVQVEKLKEEKDFYKEQSEDYKAAYLNAVYDTEKAEKYATKLEQDVSMLYGQIHNLEEEKRVLAQENSTLIKHFLKSKKEENQAEKLFARGNAEKRAQSRGKKTQNRGGCKGKGKQKSQSGGGRIVLFFLLLRLVIG